MSEGALPPEGWVVDDCVLARLYGAMAEPEVDFFASPHVVIIKSRKYGFETISGPYASGVEALAAAERDAQVELAAGDDDCDYSVARLLPPS